MDEIYYVVRFTLDTKTFWELAVRAKNEREALAKAKYDAGKAGVPIFETRIEVL